MKGQKNKRMASGLFFIKCSLSGILGMLGDKEIAVKFRSNSHYRNSALAVKSECLSPCARKGLLGRPKQTCEYGFFPTLFSIWQRSLWQDREPSVRGIHSRTRYCIIRVTLGIEDTGSAHYCKNGYARMQLREEYFYLILLEKSKFGRIKK